MSTSFAAMCRVEAWNYDGPEMEPCHEVAHEAAVTCAQRSCRVEKAGSQKAVTRFIVTLAEPGEYHLKSTFTRAGGQRHEITLPPIRVSTPVRAVARCATVFHGTAEIFVELFDKEGARLAGVRPSVGLVEGSACDPQRTPFGASSPRFYCPIGRERRPVELRVTAAELAVTTTADCD